MIQTIAVEESQAHCSPVEINVNEEASVGHKDLHTELELEGWKEVLWLAWTGVWDMLER